MVNAFVSGFFQIFTVTTFGLMLLGIVIGFSVGILSGWEGTTTLALMLPFISSQEMWSLSLILTVFAWVFLYGLTISCMDRFRQVSCLPG
jgi:TctA family transporter